MSKITVRFWDRKEPETFESMGAAKAFIQAYLDEQAENGLQAGIDYPHWKTQWRFVEETETETVYCLDGTMLPYSGWSATIFVHKARE